MYTILAEGNIAAGKSTFLKIIESDLKNLASIDYEPLNKWTNFKGCNLLNKLYEDPYKYSFQFQTYVQLTMAEIQFNSSEKPIRIIERSLFSRRYVFIEALKVLKHISVDEYNILIEWFKFLSDKLQPINEIVYLWTDPAIAHQRLLNRARHEEGTVSLEYLELIHSLHEQWLIKTANQTDPKLSGTKIRVVNQNQGINELKREFDTIISEIRMNVSV
jgi:deoxyadenosine/deoxycytidine kinase